MRLAFAISVAFTLMALACNGTDESGSGNTGSETHWLTVCESDSDCGQGSCLCGVCSIECSAAESCAEITGVTGAQCRDTEGESACETQSVPARVCLPPAENLSDAGSSENVSAGDGGASSPAASTTPSASPTDGAPDAGAPSNPSATPNEADASTGQSNSSDSGDGDGGSSDGKAVSGDDSGTGGTTDDGSVGAGGADVTTLGPCVDEARTSNYAYRESRTHSYDSDGNLVQVTLERDNELDGNADSRTVTSNTFDDEGTILETLIEQDVGLDAVVDYRTRTVFDPQERIERSYTDENADGVYDSGTLQQVDENGNLLVYERDDDFDGFADFRRTVSYDAQGNQLSAMTYEQGILASAQTTTWDALGNPLTDARDSNGDGQVDSRATNTYTYDEEGRVLTAVHSRDENADSAADYIQSHSYSYTEQGHTSVVERDADGDGSIDWISYGVFDAMGNQTLNEVDEDADGSIDARQMYTFDAAGQLLVQSSEEDEVVIQRATYTYDEDGNRLSYTQEDGAELTNSFSQTWTYECLL